MNAYSDLIAPKKNRIKNIETSAKKEKKPAYSILESKSKDSGIFDDKKGKNIGIEYWLQMIFCNPNGIVVRPHRSSLAPERLHKILFLKCNESVFDASELF